MKSEYISIFISIKKLCNKLNQESLTTRHLFAYFFLKKMFLSHWLMKQTFADFLLPYEKLSTSWIFQKTK